MSCQMKLAMGNFKKTAWVFITVFCFIAGLSAQNIPEKPNPAKFVNDFAHIFKDEEVSFLENNLKNYYDSTSSQIVVVTVASLEGTDPSDFAIKLGQKWGVGKDAKDNGVVFLIAPNERKMFIATGYGMEEKLTDVFLTRTRVNLISPEFKKGNYFEGVVNGIDAMMKRLSGTYQADPKENESDINLTTGEILLIILIIFILLIVISRISKHANYGETYSGRGINRGPFGGGFWGTGGGFGGFGGGSSDGGGGGFDFGGGDFGGGGSGGDW